MAVRCTSPEGLGSSQRVKWAHTGVCHGREIWAGNEGLWVVSTAACSDTGEARLRFPREMTEEDVRWSGQNPRGTEIKMGKEL